MATIPELSDGQVAREVECLDRLYLNGYYAFCLPRILRLKHVLQRKLQVACAGRSVDCHSLGGFKPSPLGDGFSTRAAR